MLRDQEVVVLKKSPMPLRVKNRIVSVDRPRLRSRSSQKFSMASRTSAELSEMSFAEFFTCVASAAALVDKTHEMEPRLAASQYPSDLRQ